MLIDPSRPNGPLYCVNSVLCPTAQLSPSSTRDAENWPGELGNANTLVSFPHSDMAAVQRYDDARHVRAPLTVSHSSPSILSAAESSTEKRSYQSTRAGLKQALRDSVVRSPLPCSVRVNAR